MVGPPATAAFRNPRVGVTGRWVRRGEPGPYMVCGHGHGRGRIDEVAADRPDNTALCAISEARERKV